MSHSRMNMTRIEHSQILTATCFNCKTVQVRSEDGGSSWVHVPSNTIYCAGHYVGPRGALATPWMQGGIKGSGLQISLNIYQPTRLPGLTPAQIKQRYTNPLREG